MNLLKTNRIIVVDDDPINNLACEILIKKLNISDNIQTYIRPSEALTYFQSTDTSEHPALLLLDINMHEMSGWNFLNELVALKTFDSQHTKIIMVSSSISGDDIQRAGMHDCISDYLTKPITAKTFKKLEEVYLKE